MIPQFVYRPRKFKDKDILIFEASKKIKSAPMFKPYSPSVLQPRGSCVTRFPRAGEYIVAVWGKSNAKEEHNYCLNLGQEKRALLELKHSVIGDY